MVVPLYDARGVMRSALARTVTPSDQLAEGARKSLAPSGYERRGLVITCPFAANILAKGRPPWWTASDPPLRVVVTEGEVDAWSWASRYSDADAYAPAVLGIVQGSWTPEVAARIPDESVLVIATDDDEAGEVYASQIVESVGARMRAGKLKVERWKP